MNYKVITEQQALEFNLNMQKYIAELGLIDHRNERVMEVN